MQQIDVKQNLVEFGGYIAAGVSVVIVAIALVFGGTSSLAQKKLKEADNLKDRLQKAMQSSVPEEQKVKDYVAMQQKNWQQTVKLEKAPGPEYFYERAKFKFIHPVPPAQQWINAPENLVVEVGMEKISVKWDAPPDLEEKKMAEITGYFLYKRWTDRGKKESKILDFRGRDNTSYEDPKAESKVEYFYKVCAYTDNKEAKGGEKMDYSGQEIVVSEQTKESWEGRTLRPQDWIRELVTSRCTGEQKGTILPSYKIELNGVADDTAIIRLHKWEKGAWRTAICRIKKGERVRATGMLPQPVGRYDWDPGWTVTKVNAREEIIRMKKIRKMVLDEKGQPVRDQDNKIMYKYAEEPYKDFTAAIEYTDEKGSTIKLGKEEDNKAGKNN